MTHQALWFAIWTLWVFLSILIAISYQRGQREAWNQAAQLVHPSTHIPSRDSTDLIVFRELVERECRRRAAGGGDG